MSKCVKRKGNVFTQEKVHGCITVDQLLFTTTLFCDSSVINWVAASNFRDQAVYWVRDQK
jgi:hypothetical protein